MKLASIKTLLYVWLHEVTCLPHLTKLWFQYKGGNLNLEKTSMLTLRHARFLRKSKDKETQEFGTFMDWEYRKRKKNILFYENNT